MPRRQRGARARFRAQLGPWGAQGPCRVLKSGRGQVGEAKAGTQERVHGALRRQRHFTQEEPDGEASRRARPGARRLPGGGGLKGVSRAPLTPCAPRDPGSPLQSVLSLTGTAWNSLLQTHCFTRSVSLLRCKSPCEVKYTNPRVSRTQLGRNERLSERVAGEERITGWD